MHMRALEDVSLVNSIYCQFDATCRLLTFSYSHHSPVWMTDCCITTQRKRREMKEEIMKGLKEYKFVEDSDLRDLTRLFLFEGFTF